MDEYLPFYGFSENPFKVTPDSRFFFLSESHREALASIIYGINERKGFVLISGEAGSGKTALIQYLSNNLGQKVSAVIIDQPDIPIEQLLKQIFLRFGLAPKDQRKASLIHQLNEYLIQMLARDENLAIIIDEADKLGKETIEELRLLSNLETSSSKLVQIILAGRPEVETKLNSKDLRAFKQRIVVRNEISRLTQDESRRYIDHRLKLVGSSNSEVFTPEAVSLICRYGKGVPGRINSICDRAFTIGHSLSKKKIGASIVRRTQKQKFLLRKVSFSMLALLGLGVIIFLGKENLQSFLKKRVPTPSIRQTNVSSKDEIPIPKNKSDFPPNGNDLTSALKDEPSTPKPNPAILIPPTFSPRPESGKKKIIRVEKGDTLSSLAKKYYGLANTTIIDQILISNPKITNPHLIVVDQEVNLPEITETFLILRSPDGTYKIHLGTFISAEYASRYKTEPVLKGRGIQVEPRKISTEETLYRVTAEKFETREECLKTIRILKEKGLLPALEDRGPINFS